MLARRLAVLALFAAGVGLFASPQDRRPRKVAFLVGVGKYDHAFRTLGTAPENDVAELAKELTAGGFEVVVLTGSKADADPLRATRANVEGRFKDVLRGTGGKPPLRDGDTLLVVLCGHGLTDKEQPFFCPVDARPDDAGTMVPLNDLIRASEAFGATTLFLVDACREVTDPNRGTRTGIQGKKVNLPAKTAVLFSCGQGQLAHQSDALGAGHGLFTFAVLKTLRGQTGLTGDVSWTDLVAGVQRTFRSDQYKALIPAGRPQVPVLATGELDDAHLLALKPSPTPAVVPVVPGDTARRPAAGEVAEEFEYVSDGVKKKGTRRVLTVDIGGGQKMEFVRIPKGEFVMGSAANDLSGWDAEKPQRKVEITTDFYLGKYEVTQAQYEAVAGTNPSYFKDPAYPVERVSWQDATRFCEALGKRIGRRAELPTEAQWERAGRAGTTTKWSFGSTLVETMGNWAGVGKPPGFPTTGTGPVGYFPPNPWGLYGMHGNVWEWCRDYYGKYADAPAGKDPLQSSQQIGNQRVLRGGGWVGTPDACRSASRHPNPEGERLRGNGDAFSDIGFRVCLPAE